MRARAEQQLRPGPCSRPHCGRRPARRGHFSLQRRLLYEQGGKLLLKGGFETTLRFRVPQELFRVRERLVLEVLAKSDKGLQKVLWAKRWEVAWRGKAPALEPIAE